MNAAAHNDATPHLGSGISAVGGPNNWRDVMTRAGLDPAGCVVPWWFRETSPGETIVATFKVRACDGLFYVVRRVMP